MRALLVVDVQNDFTEGGALGVSGGHAVAAGITALLRGSGRSAYALVVASRDWHDAASSNGGHFAAPGVEPDFRVTWPVHCVADTVGAAYDPNLDTSLIDVHVRKGMGAPAYSMFEGVAAGGGGGGGGGGVGVGVGVGAAGGGSRPGELGVPVADQLVARGVTTVDVVGIATDYCVRATALDALAVPGIASVRVLASLVAGVAPGSSSSALDELRAAGVEVVAG